MESLLPKSKPKKVITIIIITIFWLYYLTLRESPNLVPQPARPKPAVSICAQKKVSLEEKVAFMSVNGKKTLLLSAYMEHRKKRQVRVISVVLRSESQNYRCSMCCNEKLNFSKGVGDIHRDHFGFSYGTADIMCDLPEGCETPSHIAVTDNATSSDLHEPVYLEVKNQNKNVALPYNFTVCISTMYNYTNVLQLVQSLEMMQLLGVDRVAIYKSDCSPETQRVLDYYTKKGLVEVIPWPISKHLKPSHSWQPARSPGDIHYFGQIPALTDCLYRYMYQSKYVSLQDIDELILPQSVDSWSDLLPQLEKKYGVNKCYMFQNNLFPTNFMQPLPGSQKQPIESWKYVPGVNILAHLHQRPVTRENEHFNFKVIVNPRAVFRTSVHDVLESMKGCTWVDRNIARMYHTRAGTPEMKAEQLVYDGRLLKYSDRLISAVNTVLKETRLLLVSQEEKVAFMAVNGTKTLLLSAYMEHRKESQVRVISIVRRSEDQNYHCRICCNEKLYFSKGVGDIYGNHFGFSYGTADIMCPLPKGCETPSHIAVTDNATSSDLHEPVYLEVKNQNKSVALSYNFTVCISTMYDYTNVLQLVQALEMMQLLGVDRVAIYKRDCSPETQRVLDYYTKKGLVEVIPWPISKHLNVSHSWQPARSPGDIQYYGQIPALTDCLYRYMYQSKYVSLQDIDELILPQSVDSWSDLLPQLEKKYGVDKCYMFQNNVFPTTITVPLPASQKQPIESPGWEYVPGVNILAHLHQRPVTSKNKYGNSKVIVNPRAVFQPSVHGLLKSMKGCTWVDRDIARMYHTRAGTPDMKAEQLVYDGRLLKYSDRLIPAVNTVLKETRLLLGEV